MGQAISIRKMAALLGVSKSQVDRDAKAGMPMGSVEEARAWRLAHHDVSRTAEGRIDRPAQTSGIPVAVAEAGFAPRAGAEASSAPADSGDGDGDAEPEVADANTVAYRQDRARNERIKADRAELELKQLQGELVLLSEVKQLQFTAGRITRDRIEMVPARAAGELHALVLSLLPDEHRAVVAEQFALHVFERRLGVLLREALNEAAQAIEESGRDDDDESD